MMYPKMKKGFVVLGMCLLLILGMAESVLARDSDFERLLNQSNAESNSANGYGMGYVAACGEEGLLSIAYAVFAQSASQGYIFTTYAPLTDEAVSYIAQIPSGETIDIQYVGAMEEAGLIMWQPVDGTVNSSFKEMVRPYKQQEVQVIYYDMQGNLRQHRTSVSGVVNAEQGIIELDSLEGVEGYPPAVVLDTDGNCVAVITDKATVACGFEEEYFYGSGTSGAIIGAIAAVATVGFLALKNKKAKKPTPDPIPQPTPEPRPIPEPMPQPIPEPWPIPEPMPQPLPKPWPIPEPMPQPIPKPVPESTIQLRAVGGYMDGRVFPIDRNAITFGRNPSSTICYPADTKGVSRIHCKLFWKNGTLMLMDMGSSYGTYIKGRGRLNREQAVAVKSGDVFYIGEKNNGFLIK